MSERQLLESIKDSRVFQIVMIWLPPILIGIGVTLAGIGHAFAATHAFFPFIKDIGLALVVGGAFSAFVKSMQYREIFKRDVEDVVYGEKFLSNRKDTKRLWEKLTHYLSAGDNIDFKKDLTKTIHSQYLSFPADLAYFSRSYSHVFNLHWQDKEKSIVKVIDCIEYELVPLRDAVLFRNTIKFNATDPTPLKFEEIRLRDVETNKDVNLNLRKIDANNTEDAQCVFEKKLDGRKIYRFSRTTVRGTDITLDPTIKIKSRYTYQPDVHIVSHEPDIVFAFESSGVSPRFEDVATGSAKPKNQERRLRYPGLMLPHQGYILTIIHAHERE